MKTCTLFLDSIFQIQWWISLVLVIAKPLFILHVGPQCLLWELCLTREVSLQPPGPGSVIIQWQALTRASLCSNPPHWSARGEGHGCFPIDSTSWSLLFPDEHWLLGCDMIWLTLVQFISSLSVDGGVWGWIYYQDCVEPIGHCQSW